MPTSDTFPPALLQQSVAERLAYFKAYTVAHPTLVAADATLGQLLREPAGASLVFVFGPTGVGKTTLRRRIEQRLCAEALPELDREQGRLPVVGMEAVAPDSGTFRWRDYYVRALVALEAPLLGSALVLSPEGADRAIDRSAALLHRIATTEVRRALEQALRQRRPTAFLIDEAQHLTKMASGRRLQDQVDCLKSLASLTETVHVLIGTYDLLAFRDLNAQLRRRSVDIHLPRYQAESAADRRAFQSVLWAFQRHLPLAAEPDLLRDWEFCYERSVGCVGILKEWLTRCLVAVLEAGEASLTSTQLHRWAPAPVQCLKLLAEARDGEAQLAEPPESSARLRLGLGLASLPEGPGAGPDDATGAQPPVGTRRKSDRRVGERQPTRDPVGGGSHGA
jgi:GH24 family phage-related lysozyme (muramidase)